MKLVRVLVYEGDEEWIKDTLDDSAIKREGEELGFYDRSLSRRRNTITEILRLGDTRKEVNEAKKD